MKNDIREIPAATIFIKHGYFYSIDFVLFAQNITDVISSRNFTRK